MNALVCGFLTSFLLILIVLLLLHFVVNPKLEEKNTEATGEQNISKETTIWINSLVSKVMSHFRTEEGINFIEKTTNDKIAEKKLELKLHTVGKSPTVNAVSTITHKDDASEVIVPVEWIAGPSCDISYTPNKDFRIEFDLRRLQATAHLAWKSVGEKEFIYLTFDKPEQFDVAISIVTPWYRISPFICPFGPILFRFVAGILINLSPIKIELPDIQEKIQAAQKSTIVDDEKNEGKNETELKENL